MVHSAMKYNFKIVIDGLTRASFLEVSGAKRFTNINEYRDDNILAMLDSKMQGIFKHDLIMLKWGLSTDKEFIDWVINCGEGTLVRKKIVIQQMDEDNSDVIAIWEVANAWPCKYTAPDFEATASEVPFYSIELAHDGFNRIQ